MQPTEAPTQQTSEQTAVITPDQNQLSQALEQIAQQQHIPEQREGVLAPAVPAVRQSEVRAPVDQADQIAQPPAVVPSVAVASQPPVGQDLVPTGLLDAPLVVGVLDASHSQEQKAEQLAHERLIGDKAQLDAERQAFLDRHPNMNSPVGRVLLGVISTARHPVESVFRQNLFRTAYLQKYKYEFLTGEQRPDIEIPDATVDATVDRFANAANALRAGDTQSHDTLKHANETLLADENPEVVTFKADLTDLMRSRVAGDITATDFEEAKSRLLSSASWIKSHEVGGKNTTGPEKGSVLNDTIDNITKATEQLMAMFEHTQSMEAVDAKLASLQLVTGEARVGPRTEAKQTQMVRIIQKTSSTRLGSLVNEKTVAVAVAAAGAIVTRGATSTASKIIRYGTFGLGGVIAGAGTYARERMNTREERALVSRQMATGEQTAGTQLESLPNREALTGTINEMVGAQDLLQMFQSQVEAMPADSADMSKDDIMRLVDTVASARATLRWGDQTGQDTVRYSSADTMESERLALDMQIIQMSSFLEQHFSEEQHRDQLPPGMLEFRSLLDAKEKLYIEEHIGAQQGELDAKFEAFSKDRAFKAAAMTVAGGVLTGYVAKELLGGVLGGGERTTTTVVDRMPRPLENQTQSFFGVDFTMPKDWHFEAAHSGTGAAILDSHGNIVADNLTANAKGGFTAEALTQLKSKGMRVDMSDYTVNGPPTEVHSSIADVSSRQARVQRLWQDNNTSQFDRNELDTLTRIDNGQIVVDVRSMTPGGSFHGNRFVDATTEFKKGNGQLLFSLDKNHQGNPLQMNIDKDGMVRIPVDSDQARNLFDTTSGKPVLKPAFMEVATGRGMTPDGRQQFDVLSTVVGKNNVTDIVTQGEPSSRTLTHTVLTAMGPGESTTSTVTDHISAPWLFIPPPLSRFGLEGLPVQNAEQDGQRPQREAIGPSGAVPGRVIEGIDQPAVFVMPPGPSTPGVPVGAIGPGPENPLAPTGPRELEAGERMLELAPRAESFKEINQTREAIGETARILAAANLDFDQGLKDRLNREVYTQEDLMIVRDMLDRAGVQIGGRVDPEAFQLARDISVTKDWYTHLERRFDAERLDQLTLLYDITKDIQKFEELGFKMAGSKAVADGRIRAMIRSVRQGKQLDPEQYSWLTGIVQISATLSDGASRRAENIHLSLAKSQQEKQQIQVDFAKRRERLQGLATSRTAFLARLQNLAGGAIEAGPIGSTGPITPNANGEVASPDSAAAPVEQAPAPAAETQPVAPVEPQAIASPLEATPTT